MRAWTTREWMLLLMSVFVVYLGAMLTRETAQPAYAQEATLGIGRYAYSGMAEGGSFRWIFTLDTSSGELFATTLRWDGSHWALLSRVPVAALTPERAP